MPRLRAVFALASAVGLTCFLACSSFEDAPPADDADGGGPSLSDGTAPDGATDGADDAGPTRSEQYRAAVLADGPLVYWRMGHVVQGLIVPDETTNKNDLLLTGTADFSVDASGIFPDDPAIRFAGKTAFGQPADSGPLAFNGFAPFTLECWARRELSDAGDAGPFLQHLISYVDGNSGNGTMNGYLIYLRFGESTYAEHGALDGGGTQVGKTGLEPYDTWAHYAVVFDGTNYALYIDGQLQSSQPVKGPLQPRVAQLTIAKASNEGARFFQGSMDEIAIYPKKLDPKVLIAHSALGHGL